LLSCIVENNRDYLHQYSQAAVKLSSTDRSAVTKGWRPLCYMTLAVFFDAFKMSHRLMNCVLEELQQSCDIGDNSCAIVP